MYNFANAPIAGLSVGTSRIFKDAELIGAFDRQLGSSSSNARAIFFSVIKFALKIDGMFFLNFKALMLNILLQVEILSK